MKRSSSSTDSNHTLKKFCARESSPCSAEPPIDTTEASAATTSTKTSSPNDGGPPRPSDPITQQSNTTEQEASGNMSAIVLNYVQDIVQCLDKGRIDYCLSNRLTAETLDSLDPHYAEIANSLDTALKNIAQRQLQLETENLRYRIAIQQQHQLLTSQQSEDPRQDSAEDDVPLPSSALSSNTTSADKHDDADDHAHMTPEDGIPTIRDSSMIERMQTPAHPILPLSSRSCLGNNFCSEMKGDDYVYSLALLL